MFTIDRAYRSDTLSVTLKVTDEVFSHCSIHAKNFIIKELTVNFADGELLHVKATGPLRKKDGSEHARLGGESYILGAMFSRAVNMDNLPDWASDLPKVLATDETCTEYLSRYWSEKSPEDLAGDPIYVAYR